MGKRKFSDKKFIRVVEICTSMAQVLRKLNMCSSKWNYESLYKKISEMGLSTAHWKRYQVKNGYPLNKTPSEQVFTRNGVLTNSSLRARVLKDSLLEYKCEICGIFEWQGEKISLQLDHKNGNRNDHRLENLRWLCPNCHSQTPTWGRKGSGANCLNCGKKITSNATRCRKCESKTRMNKNTKIDWPASEDLKNMVEKTSFVEVARRLGVTDNAVRKRIKKYK